MSINKIGIMQGRLSPRPYPLLQQFPRDSWKQEFIYAKDIGYDFIEWIFEENNYEQNPIWTPEGRTEIKRCISETGITVESICADFFLENPLFRRKKYSLNSLIDKLKLLISYAADIGAKVILFPVLENAEITDPKEEAVLVSALKECLSILDNYHVKIGLETELEAKRYYLLSEQFKSENIGVYYDTGNCAFRGYDMKKDMEILKPLLLQVHIKDRLVGGGSVFLGTGATNFLEGIPYLQEHGYKGNYVMQTYFEDDYLGAAKKNLEWIRKLVK